nr:hypothetical protein [Tanacetum cinerariifolium]
MNIVVNDCMNVNCLNADACEHCTYKQLFDSIKSSCVQSKEQCDELINKVNLKSVEVTDLNARLQEKVLVTTALKEQLKGKAVLSKAVSLNPIDPALLQVDVVPLVPKLRKNRTAHIDYIKHTLEEAATLRELVESERLLSPLNTSLAYACKCTRRIQELLMIFQQTFPRITDLGTNLVAVTPKNQTKQVRRTPQITKSEKTSVDTSPSPNIDSNTPVLSSTGVVSSASGSKSKYNTKKNRIRKSKSVKKPVKRKVWKTIGKVFKTVGYKWTPTRQTFTLVGNVCPLTRIATATIVPPREPIPIVKSTDKPVVTLVYTRKPKAKNVPNKMEPNKSWGSSSNVSTSITNYRLSKSSFGNWTPLKYQHLKESLGNNNSLPAQDDPDFDSAFEIKKLKASIQGKDNAIRKLRTQISQLQETRSEADRTLDFRALDFQIT